jgi:hypothetical protein
MGSNPNRADVSPMPDAGPWTHGRHLVIGGVFIAIATLAVMLATEPRLAIVWDEGYTLGREARLRNWFRALVDPVAFAAHWTPPREELVQQVGARPPRPDQVHSRARLLFDRDVLAYFWPFAREEPHGHPPFYALLGLVGDFVCPGWQELPRGRLGPICLFSLTAGAIWWFVARCWGIWPAIAAVGAWVFQPNLFGHGHYASYDAVLTSLWVLAIIGFAQAVKVRSPTQGSSGGWLACMAFGVAVGCAMATKLTGWFLPVPFLIWTACTRDRRAIRTLLVGLPVACMILFVLNPPWWTEPITGVVRFLQSNLTRGQTRVIPVEFLGTVYWTPNQSLPWYNTLVWTLFVTPVGFLLLGLSGLVRAARLRKSEPIGLLILLHWVLLLMLRALPHTPGHDGVRLFLPAFGVLALLVGMGVSEAWGWVGRGTRAVTLAAVAEGIVSVAIMMPVPLSYFSPLVGGLPGASWLGMEPTYYWDGLTAEACGWLRANTGPGQTIAFPTFPTSWLYLKRTGDLPPRLAGIDVGQPFWYVMQNRPGDWTPEQRQLVRRATPAFKLEKLGVPLVWVFRFEDWEQIRAGPPTQRAK